MQFKIKIPSVSCDLEKQKLGDHLDQDDSMTEDKKSRLAEY